MYSACILLSYCKQCSYELTILQFTTAGADLDLLTPPSDEGFTAVILTYSRVSELFKTIRSMSAAPSLAKVGVAVIPCTVL